MIFFTVYGEAKPQGSARAFVPKGWKRAVVTSDNKGLKSWRQIVTNEAQNQVAKHGRMLSGPCELRLHFRLPRPKRLKPIWTNQLQASKPDLDKLVRSVCDSLTKVLITDDAVIARIVVEKYYAEHEWPARVDITLKPLDGVVDAQPVVEGLPSAQMWVKGQHGNQ